MLSVEPRTDRYILVIKPGRAHDTLPHIRCPEHTMAWVLCCTHEQTLNNVSQISGLNRVSFFKKIKTFERITQYRMKFIPSRQNKDR